MQVGNRNTGTRLEIGWFRAVILVIAWLIIISLARDVWQIKLGFNRITESEKRLEAEEVKNNSLKQKLELVITEGYREKLIREKLNMQKDGEVTVVLPGRTSLGTEPASREEEQEQTWQKWWNLIN